MFEDEKSLVKLFFIANEISTGQLYIYLILTAKAQGWLYEEERYTNVPSLKVHKNRVTTVSQAP